MTAVRTKPTVQIILALTVAALAVLVSGCGDRRAPADSVATVNGAPISKGDFNHWLDATIHEDAYLHHGRVSAKLDPPTYRWCIAALRHEPQPTRHLSIATLRSTCEQQYRSLKGQVLTFLVQARWLLDEASSLGIKARPPAVQSQLEADVQQLYGTKADLQKLLTASHTTLADLRLRATIQVLNQTLLNKVKFNRNVTVAQVRAYYRQHRRTLQAPARRDILMVLAPTSAHAHRDKAAIAHGAAWAAVVGKYSINSSPTTFITRTRPPQPYQQAVFSARKDQLAGPVKTPLGFMIFKVTAKLQASPLTLAEARDTIVALLRGRRRLAAMQRFINSYQRKYKSLTECAPGFTITGVCSNAPAPKHPAAGSRSTTNRIDDGGSYTAPAGS